MEKKEMTKGTKAVVFGVKSALKIAVYVVVILVIISVCKNAISLGYQVFHQEPIAEEDGADVIVEIPVEASASEIGEVLKKNGLIEDRFVFVLQEYLSVYHDKIEGGTYVLNTGQTPDEMMAIMSGFDKESTE